MLFLLSACQGGGQADGPFGAPGITPFLPPTLIASTHAVAAPTLVASMVVKPVAVPSCTDNLTYLSDLTIEDGTQVTPGQRLDKRWQIENSGTCNWDERYRVKLIAGQALGVPPELALYPARGGTQAIIRIVFTAPNEAGTYRSAWQAYNPKGEPFGDPFYIEVVVFTP